MKMKKTRVRKVRQKRQGKKKNVTEKKEACKREDE